MRTPSTVCGSGLTRLAARVVRWALLGGVTVASGCESATIGTDELELTASLSVARVETTEGRSVPIGLTPVSATGGATPLRYSASGLPTGMVVDQGSGAVTGSPGQSGTFAIVLTVTDRKQNSRAVNFTLVVNARPTATVDAALSDKPCTQGAACSYAPITVALGTAPLSVTVAPPLPAGLTPTVSAGRVTIAGTPGGAVARTSYTLTVTDAAGATNTATFQLTINPTLVLAPGDTAYRCTTGVSCAIVPATAAGGSPPIGFTITPALPTPLLLNAGTGAISGTPVTASPRTVFRIAVTDAAGAGVVRDFALTIGAGAAPPALGVDFGDVQFANIPAGSYNRGSNNGFSNEQPVRTIAIGAFRMQKTEVTQLQWRQVMTGTALANPSIFAGCGDTCPVEGVSWDDIQQFLTRLNTLVDPGKGYRLPTEAEWEYATRAGTTGDYNVAGQTIEALGWIEGNSEARTRLVAQKLPNAFGLYDTHGNVFEWVSDWYDSGSYATSPSTNPTGPATGSARALRGGSVFTSAINARSASRSLGRPSDRIGTYGFRLARTP